MPIGWKAHIFDQMLAFMSLFIGLWMYWAYIEEVFYGYSGNCQSPVDRLS